MNQEPENRGLTLTLDLATSTGWALCDGQQITHSGVVKFVTPKGGDVYDAVVSFDAWLTQLGQTHTIREMLWERVDFCSFASAFATHHRLLTTAVWWAKRNGILYFGIPLSTHREHCGLKSGDKLGAIEYARRRFGIEPKTDDEADALCMSACVIDGKIDELPGLLEESAAKKKMKTDAKRKATLARKAAQAAGKA